MSYIVENLSERSLQKIFSILDHIKGKAEIEDCKKFLFIRIGELEGVSYGEHRVVIENLAYDKIIKENMLSLVSEAWFHICIIHVDKPFFDFYNKVKVQMEKSRNSDIVRKVVPRGLEFDSDDGTLYFMGYAISMTMKGPKTNAHKIFEYIFKAEDGLAKRYPYWMIEESTSNEESWKWKKYYHACEDANLKILKESGIGDFLDFTTGPGGWVGINEKYLT